MNVIPLTLPDDLAAWMREHGPVETTAAGYACVVTADAIAVDGMPDDDLSAAMAASAPGWVRGWMDADAP